MSLMKACIHTIKHAYALTIKHAYALTIKHACERMKLQGGEDAQFATMMTELKATPSQQKKPSYKVHTAY